MKSHSYFTILLVFTLLFAACQKEEHDIIGGKEEEGGSMSQDTEIFQYLKRSAMHDGSHDDEVDGSSCFSIQFPYEVLFRGVTIKVESDNELSALLDRIQGVGPEQLLLRFPVTVKAYNHQMLTISSRQEFAGLQQDCRNRRAMNSDPISCAQIEFPITVYLYNTAIQQTSSRTIRNKKQFYLFLENISSVEVLSLEYPIKLRNSNGAKNEVVNDVGMKNALKNCQD